MSNFVNLLDIVYPIDSVYITFSATSPADTIGGTWELLENKFLYSSTDSTGTIGGEETHVLTVDEMPRHHHEYKDGAWGWSVSVGFNSGVYHMPNSNNGNASPASNSVRGGSKAHNNMPPYITVHIYHRTA